MVQTLVVLGHCVNKMYKHYDVIMFGHRDLKIVYVFLLKHWFHLHVCCQTVYVLNQIILLSEIETIFSIFTTLGSYYNKLSMYYNK